jgi:hypothetical protein
VKTTILRAARAAITATAATTTVLIVAGGGGCQAKNAGAPTTHPALREPVRRVEVISRSSSELANSLVGRKCRVQIRRDALGIAGGAPVPMAGRWADQTSVDGTILELTDQWLVVQAPGKRVVVPHASILVIELND